MTKLNTTELQQRSLCQIEVLSKLAPENQLWTLIHKLWIGEYFISDKRSKSIFWTEDSAKEHADEMNVRSMERGEKPDWIAVTLSDAIKMCAESLI